MSALVGSATDSTDGSALLNRAFLEALAVRETVFAIGDGALVELADALLLVLGQVAGQARRDAVTLRRLPEAA